MEPLNSGDDRFSDAATSPFTFTTASSASVSGLSKPRFVKLRKHNNASVFNRDGSVANAAVTVVGSDKVDSALNFDKRISDRLKNLKIGTEGFGNAAIPEAMMSKLKISTEGFDKVRVESELGNELKKKLSIGENEGGNNVEDSANSVIRQLNNLNVNDGMNNKFNLVDQNFEPNLCNSSAMPSSGLGSGSVLFQPFEVNKKDQFVFQSKPEASGANFVEFKSHGPKIGGKEGKLKEKTGNMRMNKSRVNLKNSTPAPVQRWNGHGFVFKGSVLQEDRPQGSSESCSPMEVSPYQEKLAESRTSRESSVN